MRILGRFILTIALASQSGRAFAALAVVPSWTTLPSLPVTKGLFGAMRNEFALLPELTFGMNVQQATPSPTPTPGNQGGNSSPVPNTPGNQAGNPSNTGNTPGGQGGNPSIVIPRPPTTPENQGRNSSPVPNSPGNQAGNPSSTGSTPSGQGGNPSIVIPRPPGSAGGTSDGGQREPSASATTSNETPVHVRLDKALSSATAKKGERWTGTLANDVLVDGQTVAQTGDKVLGEVTFVKSSAGLKNPGQLTLRLIAVNDRLISSSARKQSSATTGIVGGFLGGGNGAAIAAIASGGAGTGSSAAGAGATAEARLPAETEITFVVGKEALSQRKGKQHK